MPPSYPTTLTYHYGKTAYFVKSDFERSREIYIYYAVAVIPSKARDLHGVSN